jgi:hypothetical protein
LKGHIVAYFATSYEHKVHLTAKNSCISLSLTKTD